EAEAVSGPVAATLEPVKPSQHMISFFDRYPRSAITDPENRPIGASPNGDRYLAVVTAMLYRIVDKIGDRIEQKIAIANHVYCFYCWALGYCLYCLALGKSQVDGPLLGHGLEQLKDFANDFTQIDVAERRRSVARLDLRDPQQ